MAPRRALRASAGRRPGAPAQPRWGRSGSRVTSNTPWGSAPVWPPGPVDRRGQLVATMLQWVASGPSGSAGSVCRQALRRSWDDPGVTTRRVAWRRSDDVETDEHCTLTLRDGGLSLGGTLIGAEGGLPVRVEYRVLA